ncbi:MAG: HAMP domain-containing histidine kinase [Clostridia bacterium]|nr:HAMP domain-containing histidine kinase [Clostridia bacterium]
MKNRELFNEKMKLVGELILRIVVYFVITIIFYIVVLDALLGSFLGNTLYKINYELYYWCVNSKEEIFMIYIISILIFVLYRFFSKKIDNIEKLYTEFDSILKEDSKKIELSNDMTKFSEKLNQIKYEYILSIKRAKEAEQKKNDLIMYMAHDLKTPLTSVIGYLSLLNEEKEISKNLKNKYIKIALDKSLRLEELTNQFFEITRYNLNDMPINRTNIDLVMLLEQLIEEFYPMLEERNLKLNINKPSTVIYNADGDKLARAFGNLLKNAINYSYENTTISIELIENESEIEIIFKNKGSTIPEYKLEKIFDKFYRTDDSRQSNNGGAGLGLAITKEIVELHKRNYLCKK